MSYLDKRGVRSVNRLLGKAGIRLVRSGTVVRDLRGETDNPVAASLIAGLTPFVIDFDLKSCRILISAAFACSADAHNPFVETLIGVRNGAVTSFENSSLSAFYAHWTPANAAEVLGFDPASASARLAGTPPLGVVMPWNAWTPEKAMERWSGFIERDHMQHGRRGDVDLGWKGWGPIDRRVGDLEFGRLCAVQASIEKSGYRRSDTPDGDIKGVVLERAGEWRVMVTAGHHRAAALAALGHSSAPVRIDNQIVRRSDVELWPNVQSKLFDTEAALAVFDRIFEARQPVTLEGWEASGT